MTKIEKGYKHRNQSPLCLYSNYKWSSFQDFGIVYTWRKDGVISYYPHIHDTCKKQILPHLSTNPLRLLKKSMRRGMGQITHNYLAIDEGTSFQLGVKNC